MFYLGMDEGERFPVRFDVPDADLTGATVAIRLASSTGTKYAGSSVTLDAASSDGKVHGGVVLAPATAPSGVYDAEVAIKLAGQTLEDIEPGQITVRPRPAKPVP